MINILAFISIIFKDLKNFFKDFFITEPEGLLILPAIGGTVALMGLGNKNVALVGAGIMLAMSPFIVLIINGIYDYGKGVVVRIKNDK